MLILRVGLVIVTICKIKISKTRLELIRLLNLPVFSTASETLREESLNFKSFYASYKYIDPNYLTWLIGFIEGDGYLGLNNGVINFSITQKEQKILLEIQEMLGFGYVKFDKTMNCYRFKVYKQSDLYLIALLLNGNLVLPHRISQLCRWITVLSAKYNITHNPKPFVPTLSDFWISGFTDAEGSFFSTVVKRSTAKYGYRIRIKFCLDQRDKETLIHIKNLFGYGSVNETNGKNSNPGLYRYTNTSFINVVSVIDYFNKFPLKTKKQFAFNKWCNVRLMLLNKEHLTSFEKFTEIVNLCKLINKYVD